MNEKRYSIIIFVVISFLYIVGIAGHAIPFFLPWMIVLTPWFLLGAGAAIVATYGWKTDWKVLLACFVPILLLTFGLEALGVATGLVFGPYHYTDTLGMLFLGVPPVIGMNWVLVVLGVHTAVLRLLPNWNRLLQILMVALACVAFDYLLEPVAISLEYWVWHDSQVPLQNYFAWGLIAIVASWWAGKFQLPNRPILSWYVVLQALFFALLAWLGIKV